MLKSVFFGNSEFCLPSLEVLKLKTDLSLICTGPDKKVGRGMQSLKIPEPKEFALKNNIEFLQTYDFNEIFSVLKKLQPDIIIVISYGKIIPNYVFNLPKIGTFNIHASLLPKYRGASPIQEAIINQDKETGITIQRINERLDEGNIVYTKKIDIYDDDNYITLREKLSFLAADSLKEFIDILSKGILKEERQYGPSSYCRKIKKEDGKIDWKNDKTNDIINKWRAFILWPNIFTYYKGKKIIIRKLSRFNYDLPLELPGRIHIIDRKLIVETVDGLLFFETLKPENSREMSYLDFINGYKIKTGEVFE